MAVNDDEIIRRRLLIEADGGNDDKRISSLLRTFVKWTSSPEHDDDSHTNYQRMLASLTQCEYAVEKSHAIYQMNTREQQNYEKLNKEIEENIKEAFDKIAECKSELHQAKRIRKNRQEYDALAKTIQKHPDRQKTLKELEALDKELAELKETKESLEQKLDIRRKQFHVLIAAIHEMQRIVEEDENKEEDEDMDAT
ncbi:unnamed protein product [Owenia fusiformis]|uniref:THO complex subunit 7 homolog n=1 Tax=Owenia fusiformis TaxID=6347 RepID=A0A8J1T4V8_OWEFU|nr:unnamed protein product [Owenia fusiformis]